MSDDRLTGYWVPTVVRGPTTAVAVNGGPMEPEPFGNYCEAFAAFYQPGDDPNGPARGLFSAIGYTPLLARWNLELKLRLHGETLPPEYWA